MNLMPHPVKLALEQLCSLKADVGTGLLSLGAVWKKK